jgi:hypothetical protein
MNSPLRIDTEKSLKSIVDHDALIQKYIWKIIDTTQDVRHRNISMRQREKIRDSIEILAEIITTEESIRWFANLIVKDSGTKKQAKQLLSKIQYLLDEEKNGQDKESINHILYDKRLSPSIHTLSTILYHLVDKRNKMVDRLSRINPSIDEHSSIEEIIINIQHFKDKISCDERILWYDEIKKILSPLKPTTPIESGEFEKYDDQWEVLESISASDLYTQFNTLCKIIANQKILYINLMQTRASYNNGLQSSSN